jgi:hypothetical protein
MLFVVHIPELHVSPAQHAWPCPPHCAQMPFAQPRLFPHEPFAQHGWPAPPHAAHVPPAHVAPIAVHWLFAQHAIPRPPQLPQLPFVHARLLMEHVVLAPTHVLGPPPIAGPTQHPPLLHAFRVQHGSPAAPHTAQIPFAQIAPELHWLPAQHA